MNGTSNSRGDRSRATSVDQHVGVVGQQIEAAEADRPRARDIGAAHQHVDARVEFVGVEGFDQVVVGTDAQAVHPIGHPIARGHHQHGALRVAAPVVRQPYHTVAVGQREIEQDDVESLGGERAIGLGQRRRMPRQAVAVTPAQQQLARDVDVVFDQQQAHGTQVDAAANPGACGAAAIVWCRLRGSPEPAIVTGLTPRRPRTPMA